MVQAGQLEPRLQRLEQGEVSIKLPALQLVEAVIGIHDGHYTVHIRRQAVVVFVPHHDDGVVASSSRWGAVNRVYEFQHGLIAEENQGRVEAGLRAVGVGIVIAEGSGVAAPVLVIALVRDNKGQVRQFAGSEIGPNAVSAVKANDLGVADERVRSLLYVLEVNERVVLRRVQPNNVGLRERRVQLRVDLGEISVVGKFAVAVIHRVGTGE